MTSALGSLESYRQRYEENLLGSVIPFWLKHSPDREHGGYFTCLDRDGSVYDTRKYIWLQGRQVWMLSRLYNQVEPRPEWLEAARHGIEFLRRHAFDSQGRVYFSLTREGLPDAFQRKPYAAVFLVLALLEYSKTGAGEPYRTEAIDLFWRIRTWIDQPELLGRPRLAGQPPMSVLAHIMVQVSMALELAEATGDPRYDHVLRECLDAAFRHYDQDARIFIEHVAPDGRRLNDLPEGRLFCPGHSIEVAWFLLHVLERLPDEPRKRQALEAVAGSLEAGWDPEFDGLYYFMDTQGKPLLQLEAGMKLWWPHTEAIYGLVLAHSLTGESRWLDWLDRVDRYAFEHFADPAHGEWFGYCHRDGSLSHSLKGNNYKGCFHVPRALLFSIQRIRQSL